MALEVASRVCLWGSQGGGGVLEAESSWVSDSMDDGWMDGWGL